MTDNDTLSRDLTAVQRVAREVVLLRGTVATAVGVGGTFLIAHHVITPGVDATTNSAIEWVFAAAVFVAGLAVTRSGTTVADNTLLPRDSTNERLVTSTVAAHAVIAAVNAVTPESTTDTPFGLTTNQKGNS